MHVKRNENKAMSEDQRESKRLDRFEFGKNWQRFLSILDEDRILEAEISLKQMLETDHLKGKSFLDVGSGCTMELKRRYFPSDGNWTIEQGDVLNLDYLKSLGQFDVVYSWGVLHHTGAMWQALENVEPLVAEKGKLYISIYNDQGSASLLWMSLKRFYNRSSKSVKGFILLGVGGYRETISALGRLVRCENPLPFKRWAEMKKRRGMSTWYDLVDWVGGYPFEVAKPEEILDFYRGKGFELVKLKTCAGGIGCNEYVFVKEEAQRQLDQTT
jgi:hypothetical protein